MSLTKKLNLENKLEFLGYIKPETLKQLTAQADIGINLLENKGLSYYYSLSNKFFDYIQQDIPQVCIDFPEYKKINEQYEVALLIKNCSVHEIKATIERLITDKNLYSQLKKNCEVCRQILNWNEEEKKLISLYNDLLQ